MLRAYGISEKGRIRASNEDCFAIDEPLQLCVVADGMGGHNAGEIAARLAVDSLAEFVRNSHRDTSLTRAGAAGLPGERWPFGFDSSLSEAGNRVRTGIALANIEVLEKSMTAPELEGMGTTIVVALIEGRRLSVGHVGDSRMYLLVNDGLRPLTRDDSWVEAVRAQESGLDPIAMRLHPMRNALTNVVGSRPRTDVHALEVPLLGGEILLLSTDGIHGVLDDGSIEQVLRSTGDLREMASGLVDTAIARGSRDNCTAVVARYSAD